MNTVDLICVATASRLLEGALIVILERVELICQGHTKNRVDFILVVR